MAAKVNWNADQGATLNKTIYRVRTSMGAPVDLTTYSASLCFLRKNYAANTPVASFDVTLTANGEVIVAADQTTMAALKAGRYVYDVTAVLGSTATRLVEGYVSVDPAATLGPPPPEASFDLEANYGDQVEVVSSFDNSLHFYGGTVTNVSNTAKVVLGPPALVAQNNEGINAFRASDNTFIDEAFFDTVSDFENPGYAAVLVAQNNIVIADGMMVTVGSQTFTFTVANNVITAVAVGDL